MDTIKSTTLQNLVTDPALAEELYREFVEPASNNRLPFYEQGVDPTAPKLPLVAIKHHELALRFFRIDPERRRKLIAYIWEALQSEAPKGFQLNVMWSRTDRLRRVISVGYSNDMIILSLL